MNPYIKISSSTPFRSALLKQDYIEKLDEHKSPSLNKKLAEYLDKPVKVNQQKTAAFSAKL
jgi:hypothetical protein